MCFNILLIYFKDKFAFHNLSSFEFIDITDIMESLGMAVSNSGLSRWMKFWAVGALVPSICDIHSLST